MVHEWRQGEYLISTDKKRLDLAVIHNFLTTSYWAAGIPLEVVRRSIEHSLSFGLYKEDQQIGYARVITEQLLNGTWKDSSRMSMRGNNCYGLDFPPHKSDSTVLQNRSTSSSLL